MLRSAAQCSAVQCRESYLKGNYWHGSEVPLCRFSKARDSQHSTARQAGFGAFAAAVKLYCCTASSADVFQLRHHFIYCCCVVVLGTGKVSNNIQISHHPPAAHSTAATQRPLLCAHRLFSSSAGLTHDLGHGPFSHVFEKELLPRLGLPADLVKTW